MFAMAILVATTGFLFADSMYDSGGFLSAEKCDCI
jgi:hypothetical protein